MFCSYIKRIINFKSICIYNSFTKISIPRIYVSFCQVLVLDKNFRYQTKLQYSVDDVAVLFVTAFLDGRFK